MRKTAYALLAVFLFWIGVAQCFAWDTKVGHPKTTDAAMTASGNLNKFIVEFRLVDWVFVSDDTNDDLSKDWNKKSDRYMLTGWLRKGSIFEDYGPDHTTSNTKKDNRRFLNHYYDGISHNGLFHLEWVKNTVNFFTLGIFNNTPAITPQPTLPWAKDGVGVDGPNDWSWKKAREYEFNALTAQDKNVRNENFAKMFRSVGQVSHLLEDMAQPGHVRNDAHVSMDDSEAGARILNSSTHEEWVKHYGDAVDVGIYENKDIIRKDSLDKYFNELAWLINRNFYSDDTIPLRVSPDGEIEQINGAYSRPAIADTDFNAYKFDDDLSIVKYSTPPYDAVLDEDGKVRRTLTITNMSTDEVVGQLLFSAGYFEEYRPLLGDVLSSRVAFKLTNNVVRNNAEIVLPMASKYAAGLVDYFFRGAMEMNESTYKITNKSGETMDGTFTLYYDDAEDKRTQVPNASWTAKIEPNAAFKPENLVLPEAAKSRPDNIKDKYILVFSGTLGSEQGAVAGKNVTLTSEEAEKKELILYSINGVYETFDPATKIVRPYNGIFKGATGKVLWREDAKAAIAQFGNDWYVVNANTNKKYELCAGCWADVAWKGDNAFIAIASIVRYSSGLPVYRIDYKEFTTGGQFVAGKTTQEIPLISLENFAVSGDGSEITLTGWRKVNYSFGYTNQYSKYTETLDGSYLIKIDTGLNYISYQKLGDSLYVKEWKTNGYTENRTSKEAYFIGYNDNVLLPIYNDYLYSSQQYWITNCPSSNYVVSGSMEQNAFIPPIIGPYGYESYVYIYCGGITVRPKDIYERVVFSHIKPSLTRARPLYMLKDGGLIFPYMELYNSYRHSTNKYIASYTPYLYLDGQKIAGDSDDYSDNSFTSFGVAMSPARDKAAIRMFTVGYHYDPVTWERIYSDTMNVLYYVTNDGKADIAPENPRFYQADFVAFIMQ